MVQTMMSSSRRRGFAREASGARGCTGPRAGRTRHTVSLQVVSSRLCTSAYASGPMCRSSKVADSGRVEVRKICAPPRVRPAVAAPLSRRTSPVEASYSARYVDLSSILSLPASVSAQQRRPRSRLYTRLVTSRPRGPHAAPAPREAAPPSATAQDLLPNPCSLPWDQLRR